MNNLSWFTRIGLAAFTGLAMQTMAQPLPDKAPQQTLGVVNCASSLCHGSTAVWNGSSVNQNEYVIWSRLDKHARAYKVLLNDKSKRIAAKLGLPAPAHLSKLCLDCHAHNPTVAAAPAHQTADGVSCEACHGPAQQWIGPHTAPDASHAQNLANGMYPADQPVARAQLCLSCHFGSTDKYVSHRIMAAGHPRLSFEMDTFTSLQPAHFKQGPDDVRRKGEVGGAKVWAIGQALAVATQMDILLDPQRGHDGAFPELTLFDCHACHHPMADARWKPRTQFGASLSPGLVRLNDSAMLMLRLVLQQTAPDAADSFKAAVTRLNQAVAGQGDLREAALAVKAQAVRASSRIRDSGVSTAQLRGMVLALVDDGLSGAYVDYAGAEQAMMALGSVCNALNGGGHIKSVEAINRGLERLRASLAKDEAYSPTEFQARLRSFRPLLGGPSGTPATSP